MLSGIVRAFDQPTLGRVPSARSTARRARTPSRWTSPRRTPRRSFRRRGARAHAARQLRVENACAAPQGRVDGGGLVRLGG